MDVQKKVLKNGLVVATEAMPHLRSVSIGVWMRGGSRCEGSSAPGISHFIEHLLFKGTSSRSAADIANEVDSVGGQLNAYTDKEYVGFYAKVQDRHLQLAFELLSDIVLHPTFPPVELRRERNVIFEEINMLEDSPQELVHELFMESYWSGHPLGRSISGTKESVAGIRRGQVVRFFQENYTARNTLISVAGNIRHREVLNLAGRYFSDLEPGSPVDLGSPPQVNRARVVRHKSNLEQTHICLGTWCPPLCSQDRYCSYILNAILGGGMSSRLFQTIREQRGLVYSIYSAPSAFRDAGALTVYAGTAPDKAATVVELTLKEMKRMREHLVSREELARAKENIKGSLILGLESSSSRMTHLAHQEMYFGRFYSLEEILAGFDRVRARDVRRLAHQMFDSSSISLTALVSGDSQGLKTMALKV